MSPSTHDRSNPASIPGRSLSPIRRIAISGDTRHPKAVNYELPIHRAARDEGFYAGRRSGFTDGFALGFLTGIAGCALVAYFGSMILAGI